MSTAVAEKPKRSAQVVEMPTVQANPLLGMLTQLATNQNFNVEAFKAVVDLVREEKDAQAKADFRRDFAAFQSEMPSIRKGGKGHNGKPHERLEDIFEGTKELRQKYGFSLNHSVKQDANSITIVAILGHRSGYEMTAEMRLPLDNSGSKNAVQAHGSTSTYGKRYTAMAVLGLAASDDVDDDAQAATGSTITDEQAEALANAIEFAGASEDRFKKHFKISELSKLPQSRFSDAMEMLKRRAGA